MCNAMKYKELQLGTDCLYFALAEIELTDCIRKEVLAEWEKM